MTNSNPTVQVFSDIRSPRLLFVLDFIFKEKGISYEIKTDPDQKSELPAISYSHTNEQGLCILPSGLLSETNITKNWAISYRNNNWLINGQPDDLSIIFYFLSRYEEYTDTGRDEYGRFTARQSLLFKNKQLHLPWCDILVKRIWEQLGLDGSILTGKFKIVLTYDIDVAWAYLHKPKWRTLANFGKGIFKIGALKERLAVLKKQKEDPYDSYELIKAAAQKHESVLFFLLGNYGKLDKNHSWKNKHLQNLIQSLTNQTKIGIHPSFNSFLNRDKVKSEAKRLQHITGAKTVLSRQHYLRMSVPQTYQQLVKIGITHDYTMGYAEHYGFRAGTSFPFYFYDLTANETSTLTIVPFTFMDGTLKEYMQLTPSNAIEVIQNLKNSVKAVGGQFVPLWHNHSIGNQKEWADWQVVYKSCLS